MTSRRILEKDWQSMSRSRWNSTATPVSCPQAHSPMYGIVYWQARSWIERQRSLLWQWFLLLLIHQQCLLMSSSSVLSADSITETEMISKLGHCSQKESTRAMFLVRRIWKTSGDERPSSLSQTVAVTCPNCVSDVRVLHAILSAPRFRGHFDKYMSSSLVKVSL